MIFNFTIHGDRLQTNTASWGHTGNVNSYVCIFRFDAEWDGLSKFAAIKTETGYVGPILISDNQCIIPYDVLQLPGMFSLGVYGTTGAANDFKRISTNWLPFKINDGAYSEGTAPEVPEPDLWEQYLAQVNSIVQGALEEMEQKVSNLYKFRGYVAELPDAGAETNETYVMLETSTKTFTVDVSDLAGGSISLYRAASANGGFLIPDEDAKKHLPKEFVMQISNGTTTKNIPVQYGVSPSAGTSTMLYWFAESDDVKSVFELYGGHSAASSITIPWTDITITYTLTCEKSDVVTWTGFFWDDGGNIFSLDGYLTEEACKEMIDQLEQQTDERLQDKADKATTLEGYGITEKYYTADQVDKMLSGYYHNKGSANELPTTGMKSGYTYNMLTSGAKTYSINKSAVSSYVTFTKVPSSDIALVSFTDADKAHLPKSFAMSVTINNQTATLQIEYGQPPGVQSGFASFWCVSNSVIFGSATVAMCYPQNINSITYLLQWDEGDNIAWTGYAWDNLGGRIPLENYYTRQETDNRYLPKSTQIGNPILVTDHLAGVPLIDYRIIGSAEGVGDLVSEGEHIGKYRVPVSVGSANLFDVNDFSGTSNVVIDGNSLVITGVTGSTNGSCSAKNLVSRLKPNTKYYISVGNKELIEGATTSTTYRIALAPSVGNSLYMSYGNDGAFTTPADLTQYDFLLIFCGAGVKIRMSDIQIVEGGTAVPYDPYMQSKTDIYLNSPLMEGQAISLKNSSLPEIVMLDANAVRISVDTTVPPSGFEVNYYQDINKKFAELQTAMIVLGGI